MADVTMPQLGETVADGTVTKWFKAEGDEVVKGEALFEVSTDKVDTEIPAPTSGVLRAILVLEGTTVDVGTVPEYTALYARFAALLKARQSDVDFTPFAAVADAFLLGRRTVIGPFG